MVDVSNKLVICGRNRGDAVQWNKCIKKENKSLNSFGKNFAGCTPHGGTNDKQWDFVTK